jgi:ferritin-like metal-binding protein YciE
MRNVFVIGERIWTVADPARVAARYNPGSNVVGLFSKDIKTMDDLLLHGLKDIYHAENQIVKALLKMVDKATNRDLKKGLKDHLEETKNQVSRLDQVFKILGHEPRGMRCPAIDGLIGEADDVAGEVEDKSVLDAAVIGFAQWNTTRSRDTAL